MVTILLEPINEPAAMGFFGRGKRNTPSAVLTKELVHINLVVLVLVLKKQKERCQKVEEYIWFKKTAWNLSGTLEKANV